SHPETGSRGSLPVQPCEADSWRLPYTALFRSCERGREISLTHRKPAEQERREQGDFGRKTGIVFASVPIAERDEETEKNCEYCEERDRADEQTERADERGERERAQARNLSMRPLPFVTLPFDADEHPDRERDGKAEQDLLIERHVHGGKRRRSSA